MACGCRKNKSNFHVVVNGKIVFVTSNRSTADAVARRYAGAIVKDAATV